MRLIHLAAQLSNENLFWKAVNLPGFNPKTDLNEVDSKTNMTPLQIAASAGNFRIVCVMLALGANTELGNPKPLECAEEIGHELIALAIRLVSGKLEPSHFADPARRSSIIDIYKILFFFVSAQKRNVGLFLLDEKCLNENIKLQILSELEGAIPLLSLNGKNDFLARLQELGVRQDFQTQELPDLQRIQGDEKQIPQIQIPTFVNYYQQIHDRFDCLALYKLAKRSERLNLIFPAKLGSLPWVANRSQKLLMEQQLKVIRTHDWSKLAEFEKHGASIRSLIFYVINHRRQDLRLLSGLKEYPGWGKKFNSELEWMFAYAARTKSNFNFDPKQQKTRYKIFKPFWDAENNSRATRLQAGSRQKKVVVLESKRRENLNTISKDPLLLMMMFCNSEAIAHLASVSRYFNYLTSISPATSSSLLDPRRERWCLQQLRVDVDKTYSQSAARLLDRMRFRPAHNFAEYLNSVAADLAERRNKKRKEKMKLAGKSLVIGGILTLVMFFLFQGKDKDGKEEPWYLYLAIWPFLSIGLALLKGSLEARRVPPRIEDLTPEQSRLRLLEIEEKNSLGKKLSDLSPEQRQEVFDWFDTNTSTPQLGAFGPSVMLDLTGYGVEEKQTGHKIIDNMIDRVSQCKYILFEDKVIRERMELLENASKLKEAKESKDKASVPTEEKPKPREMQIVCEFVPSLFAARMMDLEKSQRLRSIALPSSTGSIQAETKEGSQSMSTTTSEQNGLDHVIEITDGYTLLEDLEDDFSPSSRMRV